MPGIARVIEMSSTTDVALAGLAGEEARVAGRDLHVRAGLGDQDPDLVERPHAAAKATNVLMKGIRPIVASPAATPSMFCSAMPIWR